MGAWERGRKGKNRINRLTRRHGDAGEFRKPQDAVTRRVGVRAVQSPEERLSPPRYSGPRKAKSRNPVLLVIARSIEIVE
jgi:hypothetical protein